MRKPKPLKIYREEVSSPTLGASTRQTFDKKQYDTWRKLQHREGVTVKFFEGDINWHETYLAAEAR